MSEESVLEGWRIGTIGGVMVGITAAEEFIFKVASESLVRAMAKLSKVSAGLSSEGEIFEQLGSNEFLCCCFFFRDFLTVLERCIRCESKTLLCESSEELLEDEV